MVHRGLASAKTYDQIGRKMTLPMRREISEAGKIRRRSEVVAEGFLEVLLAKSGTQVKRLCRVLLPRWRHLLIYEEPFTNT